ncbi:MFS transporter [Fomitiporia mediterranea MF3/22]|uniref:MFS transporter n=1 Tax=Fomitiporia mediterranea (strain MF3/22) TaxID=694068 RepID=UPI0004407914|nr:MFS transporter [Fomitiporia mediterranea MF3/22]EJD05266.1 MFS transporter [Fomitiporia mediterranea MF3/22]
MDAAPHSDVSTMVNGNGVSSARTTSEVLGKAELGNEGRNSILQEKGKTILTELKPEDDPKKLPLFRKWLAVVVICSAAFCTTCTSSIASAAEDAESIEFHVSKEVTILGISLFVEGMGIGPLLLGPLSEFYGRNPVYWVSYFLFVVFSFPVAFAPNIVVFLIFRFVSGFVGSAFLSVAGGSVSDLFTNDAVATPMAIYTISPFAGPVIGPLLSGFINQNTNWRWTYYMQIIWAFTELVALVIFVPETYEPAILKNKARRLRKHHNSDIYAPLELEHKGLFHAIFFSCYKPFELLLFDRMALLLDLWTALVLGILYLAFQAFPIIFGEKHGFNLQMVGCSFLGIGIGMLLGTLSQPYWNSIYKRETLKHDGHPPPEMRLIVGMPGGILVSVGLFWIAFTTFRGVHWIVPMLGSIPFGTGIVFVFTATFTYLVTAYRPIAASAMAANSALRSTFAAGFPLFAVQMYNRLGTVGATALLAGLTAIMAPLPFIFYKYGAQIRAHSKYAVA